MHKSLIPVALVCLAAAVAVVHAQPQGSEAAATILKYENEVRGDGAYNYAFESSNNIKAEERGVGSSYATGSYSYVAPDGQPIQLEYTADENGYQPRGAHLPTPPPIPDYIVRALRYIEEHPFRSVQTAKKK